MLTDSVTPSVARQWPGASEPLDPTPKIVKFSLLNYGTWYQFYLVV